MPITITCPNCGYSGQAPDSFSEQIVRCPKCSKNFRAARALEVVSALDVIDALEVLDVLEVAEQPPVTPATPVGAHGPKPPAHIYLEVNQQKKGPFAEGQVRAMWNSGTITADTLYWREGMPRWELLDKLLEGPEQRASGRVRYNRKTDTFSGTLSAVMKLAVRAVQDLGYRIDNANESLGLLTFQTGMTWSSWNGALCSLSFEERRPNAFRGVASAKANQSGGQIFAPDLFGELKGKATKVIDRMTELADQA